VADITTTFSFMSTARASCARTKCQHHHTRPLPAAKPQGSSLVHGGQGGPRARSAARECRVRAAEVARPTYHGERRPQTRPVRAKAITAGLSTPRPQPARRRTRSSAGGTAHHTADPASRRTCGRDSACPASDGQYGAHPHHLRRRRWQGDPRWRAAPARRRRSGPGRVTGVGHLRLAR
jgi:hypothetical protein